MASHAPQQDRDFTKGEHLFEGKPDDRQAASAEAVKPTRFRPRYRNLTADEKELHDSIKKAAELLEALYEKIPFVSTTSGDPTRPVPAGRYKALALTALEESVMWAVKELTA